MRLNRRVSIWKHVRVAEGKWRYCRPVLDAKGKIIPNMVLVNGREVRHDEGTYVISYYNPTLTWQKCGTQASGRRRSSGAPAGAVQGYGARHRRATQSGAHHGHDRRGGHGIPSGA
jgi:hypothetical protein